MEPEIGLKTLFTCLKIGLTITDRSNGEIVWVNTTGSRILGCGEPELVGASWELLAGRADHDAGWAEVCRRLAGERAGEQRVIHFTRPDGCVVDARVTAATVDSGGKQWIVGELKDATARDRAHYYLQLIQDNSPISLLVVGQSGRPLFAGGKFEQDFADYLASPRTESIFEVFEAQREALALLRRAFLGEPISRVVEVFGRIVDLHLMPISQASPEGRAVVAVATDVTDRERARGEQALLAHIAQLALRTGESTALWTSAASALSDWLCAGVVVFEVERPDGELHLAASSGPPPPAAVTTFAAEMARSKSEPRQDDAGAVRPVEGLSMLSSVVGLPGEPDAVVTLYRPVDPHSDEVDSGRASTPTGVHPVGPFTRQETDFVRAVGDVLGSAAVRFATEREIRYRSLHDALTELPNRAALLDQLHDSLQRTSHHRRVGVVFVDLDGFKNVNDRYGHLAGDRLLREVADRLRHSIRRGDFVGRLAGDEFAVVCGNVESHDEVEWVARRIITALGRPVDLDGTTVTVTASAGVAISGDDLTDPDRLLNASDIAMYAAKRAGAGRYVVHTNLNPLDGMPP